MRIQAKSAALRKINTALDAILPRACVLCGLYSGSANLCAPCSADLPRTRFPCIRCALSTGSGSEELCGACLSRPPPWDRALAALDYRFPVDFLVCRFKFSRSLACGEVLADELLSVVSRAGGDLPDCLVPVPLHRWRQLRRTFNQAELLALSLGAKLSLPVNGRWLCRARRTRAQSGLNAADRRRNLEGAFTIGKSAAGKKVCGHIALVDDVCTTGETLATCTRLLRRAGAEKISIWVAARAPPP